MNKIQKKPNSIIDELEKKRALNYEKVATRMRIAIQIADGLEASGMSKKDFAHKINQQQSVITKWLSGTHNFTSDTLVEIQGALGIVIKLDNVATETYTLDETKYSSLGINIVSRGNVKTSTARVVKPRELWSTYDNKLTPCLVYC